MKHNMENEGKNLTVGVTYFKESGKWYSFREGILIPEDYDLIDRREHLTEYIKNSLPEGFTYVSLDSEVLGYPYMFHYNIGGRG